MDVRSPLFQNIALIVAGVLFLNPIAATAAQLAVDQAAGGNTSVTQAGNGVPVVNIATPNGSGLSHNKFTDYNVGQQGLILNNATDRLHSTQLGGIIIGNSNLKNGAAGLILNEVTGGNASQLKGYTEVAGRSAAVIVANPHGITCDGCGFINTPRVTLSTGAPVIENGRLQRFDVDGGQISIEGQGLNASNIDQFDLITRSARINAELHANKLNIVTGRNEVDATTLAATAKADDGSSKPMLAIDSSALGGMYAGAIRLVGTEQGVGVKLAGDMAASAGDIQIDASGMLSLSDAAAQGRIAVQAGELETHGQIYAGADLELQAGGDLLNRQTLAARDTVVLVSGGTLDNQGHIEAGVNADDSRNVSGDVRLSGDRLRNAGSVVASRDLQLEAAQRLDNRGGQLLADGNATLQSGRLDNDQGRLMASGRLQIEAGQVENREGRIASGGSLDLQASALNNDAGLLNAGKALRLDSLGVVSNRGGEVSSRAAVDLTAGGLDNSGGKLLSEGTLAVEVAGRLDNAVGHIESTGLGLDAGHLDNSAGRIVSRGDLHARVDELQQNGGELLAEGALSLSGERLDNRDGLLAANGGLTLMVDGIDNRSGEISTRAVARINAETLDNSNGELLAGRLQLQAGAIHNRDQGLIHAQGEALVGGQRLDNGGGVLASDAGLVLELSGDLANAGGLIASEGDLSLASASLNNRAGRIEGQGATQLRTGTFDNDLGRLLGQGRLDLHAGQIASRQGRIASIGPLLVRATGLNQQGGELFSQSSLSLDLNGGALNNDDALINAPGALLLKGLGAVSNRGGEISSSRGFALAASSMDNQGGRVLSEQGLVLRIQGLLNNLTGLVSARGLDLEAARLVNSEGRVSSQGDLTAHIDVVEQVGGELLAEGALELSGERLDNRDGLLAANGELQLDVDEIDNRGGEISSQSTVTVAARQLDNSASGRLLAAHLNLTIKRLLNRDQGLLYGRSATQVQGVQLDNDGGTLASDASLVLELDGALSNAGGLLSSEGTLNVAAGSLDNAGGSLSSAGALQVETVGELGNQGGSILSDGELLLRSAGLDSRAGRIEAADAMKIVTGAFDNGQGRLLGNGRLDLDAGQITSHQGRIASAGPLAVRATGLDQQGGELFSQNSLSLDLAGGALNNDGGLVNAPGTLLLNNLGAVSNRGGEISSSQGFSLAAESLDNADGRLLSEQELAVTIERALGNQAGLLSGAELAIAASDLDNTGGTLLARDDLFLAVKHELNNAGQGLIQAGAGLRLHGGEVDNRGGYLLAGRALDLAAHGMLDNRDGGLVNSQGHMELTAAHLDSSDGGEVSAKGDMNLSLGALTQRKGTLIGGAALSLELGQGDLDNQSGLIASNGPLSLENLRTLDNRDGEISSLGVLALAAASLDNRSGRLISRQWLNLMVANSDNRGGLLSGWHGLVMAGGSLDNRDGGTLSSRSGDLDLQLSGTLRNSHEGALVASGRLDLAAASLHNREQGILSSGAGQRLTVNAVLDNQGGQIDSGADLTIDAGHLGNQGGLLLVGQALSIDADTLDNSAGRISASAAARVALSGALANAGGQLASGGPMSVAATALDNRDGTLASQGLASLDLASLDNSMRGTLAANGQLDIHVQGAANNSDDGLIYSRDAGLSLAAGSLDNKDGALQSQGDLDLKISGDLLNQDGQLLSHAGVLDIEAANLDNRDGVLVSLAGWLTARLSGWLRNDAGLIQGQKLDLLASGDIGNAAGHISAQVGAANLVGASFDNRDGVLHAKGLLQVNGGAFDNQAGQVGAATIDFSLAGALDNRQGILESRGALSVAAASLDNQGGQLRALGEAGETFFQVGGLLDNRGGALESASRDLHLAIGSLANQGGSLLHAGSGELAIALAQLAGAGGSIVTEGGLTLSADSWSNSGVLQAARLTLDIGTFEQTASGQLLATESLTGRGSEWINHGLIASDGSLELNLSDSYGGDGRLTSLGDLSLAAGSLSLLETASIAAGGNASLSLGGQLLNYGHLTAADALNVSAAALANYGTLGSAERLTLSADELLNENGLLFSGGDMALYVDRFTNRYADVYSLGDLQFAGSVSGDMASRLENLSATLESLGDMTLKVATLNNRRDRLIVESGLYSARIDERFCVQPGIDCSGKRSSWFEVTQRDRLQVAEASAMSQILAGADLRIEGKVLNNVSSLISSGGDLYAGVARLDNSGVEEGEIETTRMFRLVRMESKYIVRHQNNARNFTTQYWHESSGYDPLRVDEIAGAINRIISDRDFEQELHGYATHRVLSSGDQRYAGIIQAGGNVAIKAEESIGNGVLRPAHTHVVSGNQIGPTDAGSGNFVSVTLNAQLPPDLAQQQVNPLSLPGFNLPSGQNGLFRISGQAGSEGQVRDASSAPSWSLAGQQVQANGRAPVDGLSGQAGAVQLDGQPGSVGSVGGALGMVGLPEVQANAVQVPRGELPVVAPDDGSTIVRAQGVSVSQPVQAHKYLVETNPELTNLKQFMGSDYLLGNLGFDPDQAQKRLGDGLYEQRLIREAVVARTGQRYLAGLNSDEAMYRYLMDNAIASKDALGLSLGVTLTAEQVAALTHDIVWLEEYEVLGEKVLVPVLYLAQAEGRLAANGALIQGRDVTLISGGELVNQGTLRASGDLDVSAASIANSGLIEASERLQLLATESIHNAQGGIIAGRDVGLIAGQDIVNERSVTVAESALGNRQWVNSFVDGAARIEASDRLSLTAGRDVANLGGVLDSRGDLGIGAGRDVSIVSVQDVQHTSRGSNFLSEQISQLGAEVSAGRDLSISAGRDLGTVASRVSAGRDLGMEAGGDLVIASAADESHTYFKSKKVTRQEDHVQQQASEISAGGSLGIVAGLDLNVVSSSISAGDEAYLVAGGDLDLLAAQDYDYSLYQKKKKGSFGRKSFRRDEVTTVRNVGTTITTGGDLTLLSEGDQLYQKARLESGNDLILDSGGSITFEAVKDLDQESHEKSKSSWAWTSAKGKGTTDETLYQSQLIAKGDLVIQAVDGLKIDVKEVNQQSVSQTIDAMVKADPDLAWLKEAEARGDVDWRRVKEIHDSFKYSHSGLGAGAQLILAIAMAVAMGPAGLGLTGAQGAVAASVATTATNSAISNKGNFSAVFKDVTSSGAIKGYVVSGLTAGVGESLGYNPTELGFDVKSVVQVGQLTAIQAGIKSAVYGGSLKDNLAEAAVSNAANIASAVAFKMVGDFASKQLGEAVRTGDSAGVALWREGGAARTAMHAAIGGMVSSAMGEEFSTGAIAAGASQALAGVLNDTFGEKGELREAMSQIVGVLAAGLADKNIENAAFIALQADKYNRQLHPDEKTLARRLAEQSEGRFTVEEIEDALRRSSIPGEGVYANTDMVVTADGIYDEGGKWIFGGDGRSFIQLLPDANVDAVRFVADNTSGYAWDNRSLGIQPDLQQMTYPLEFMGCIACAAGFQYSLNAGDLRSQQQVELDQRAFTLGVSSLAAVPVASVGWAAMGLRPVVTGFGLGAGFDGVGQVVGGKKYRPAQTLVAGTTGALAYPLAGATLLGNALLGAGASGSSRGFTNYIYAEDKNVTFAATTGAFGGVAGIYMGRFAMGASSALLPSKVSTGIVIDPNKPILLQGIWKPTPYPGYVGEAAGGATSGVLPIFVDWSFDKYRGAQ